MVLKRAKVTTKEADGRQLLLKEKGYIYTAKHEGWYSVADEAFYPQSAVQLYLDPPTGRKIMVGAGRPVVETWLTYPRPQLRLEAR
jgi:methionyl-tRNA synthetase